MFHISKMPPNKRSISFLLIVILVSTNLSLIPMVRISNYESSTAGAGAIDGTTPGAFYPVPPPNPVRTTTLVGVDYLTFWQTAYHRYEWGITDHPLWSYADSDPYAADWQIKWAVEHGIGFLLVVWYIGSADWATSFRDAFYSGMLEAKYLNQIKFAPVINVWAFMQNGQVVSISEQDLLDGENKIINEFFPSSSYLRIDGHPVIYLMNTWELVRYFGVESFKNIIHDLRQNAQSKGYDPLMVNAGSVPAWFDSNATWNGVKMADFVESLKAFDILAPAYGDPWCGSFFPPYLTYDEDGCPVMQAPYELLIDGSRGLWNTWANVTATVGVKFVPPVIVNFNNTNWYHKFASEENKRIGNAEPCLLVRTNCTPTNFGKMLTTAIPFGTVQQPLVTIQAWNEFGEGSTLAPSREHAFEFLDAAREAVSDASIGHADEIPFFSQSAEAQSIRWDPQNESLTFSLTVSSTTNLAFFSLVAPTSILLGNGSVLSPSIFYNGTYVNILASPGTYKLTLTYGTPIDNRILYIGAALLVAIILPVTLLAYRAKNSTKRSAVRDLSAT
jgi:hypothetical protein